MTPAGRIKDVDSMEQFKRAILSAHDSLVCVTFSAKWCGPWRMIKPDVHRLSHIHGDVIFYEVCSWVIFKPDVHRLSHIHGDVINSPHDISSHTFLSVETVYCHRRVIVTDMVRVSVWVKV